MRKSQIINLPTLYATQEYIDAVREDTGTWQTYAWDRKRGYMEYRYTLFMRAAIQDGLLAVAIYNRQRLEHGDTIPEFTSYNSLEDMEHIGLGHTWSSAMLRNRCWFGENNTYCDVATRSAICEYFEGTVFSLGEEKPVSSIKAFQDRVRIERIFRKNKKIIEGNELAMSTIPDLPAGFFNWSAKNAYPEYLIYRGKGDKKIAYCTHCHKESQMIKPKHNDIAFCPKCRTRCTIKAYGKQLSLCDFGSTGIMQKTSDGHYVYRKFANNRHLYKENDYDSSYDCTEIRRFILDKRLNIVQVYEYMEFSNTGTMMWQATGYYSHSSDVFYFRNINSVLKDQEFMKSNWTDYIPSLEPGVRINVLDRLQMLAKYPYLEYLYKSGLIVLHDEIVNRGNMIQGSLKRYSAKNLKEALELDGQQLNRLKKLNGGSLMLVWLQMEYVYEERFTDEQLIFVYNNSIMPASLPMKRTGLKAGTLINFFMKHSARHEGMTVRDVIHQYEDYLDMAQERGADLTDAIICKNNRWKEFHDMYLEEKNRAKDKSRDTDVNKRFKAIAKDYTANVEHFAVEDDKYVMLVPRKPSDITREGRRQHHCVGASDNYLSKMAKRKTFILFMRIKDKAKEPYYTIEADWEGRIIQYYAAYDRKPNGEEVKAWLDKWTSIVAGRVDKKALAAV